MKARDNREVIEIVKSTTAQLNREGYNKEQIRGIIYQELTKAQDNRELLSNIDEYLALVDSILKD